MSRTPSRFYDGATTVNKTHAFGMFGLPYEAKFVQRFNDFTKETDISSTDWTYTTGSAGTISIGDTANGILSLAAASGDNNHIYMQMKNEVFLPTSGKKMWFESKFASANYTTDSDVTIGLMKTDTSPLANTDGVYFRSSDNATTLSFFVEKDGVRSSASVGSLAAAGTYQTIAFYYDGKSEVGAWVDGIKKAALATTYLPTDEELTETIAFQNGTAHSCALYVDYIWPVVER